MQSSKNISSSAKSKISVAPMMDCTDRHCRYFLRLISSHVFLYTEMITTGAILHGDKNYLLDFDLSEHPVAIQFGGSNPVELASAAQIAEQWGYDEINLNVGCPSDRVQHARFGACLMLEPSLVAECVSAMRAAVKIPVTVKTRIGVDEHDSYDHLKNFITTVANAGCELFIIHARKAWLSGLSPRQNREIPPLRYEIAAQLKQDFPQLRIILNGGIQTLVQIKERLNEVDGIMIGREAYHNPYLLAQIEQEIFGHSSPSRFTVIKNYLPYVEQQLSRGVVLSHLIRPILGLFQGLPGARAWRRYLSENTHRQDANTLQNALGFIG